MHRIYTPSTDADMQAVTDIHNAWMPTHALTLEEIRKDDAVRSPKSEHERHLFELDGQPWGYCTISNCWWSEEPGGIQLFAICSPEFDDRASAMLDHAEARALERNPRKLTTWCGSNRPTLVADLIARGYVQEQVNPASSLDLTAVDLGRFDAVVDSVLASGIRVVTFQQLSELDPEGFVKRIWELEQALMKDVPIPGGFTEESLEDFSKNLLAHPEFWPTKHLAMDGEQLVGMTNLYANQVYPWIGFTGLTGVRRSHRRRGIATALKAINLRHAKTLDIREVWTDNADTNPMYQLNLDIGFVYQWDWLGFGRVL